MSRNEILEMLLEHRNEYLSGQKIAETFGISRTAVWKSIEALKKEGYVIRSVTNKGYYIEETPGMMSESLIRKYVKNNSVDIHYYKITGSTNTVLKEMAVNGAPQGTVAIAETQTAGRGRMGRAFFSPAQSGIYMSLLVRPHCSAEKAVAVTSAAAVAVARAIESVTGRKSEIKWVNDIYIDGRKVCGILTEASVDCENGRLSYAVVGIGINTLPPEGGFPEGIRETAGSVSDCAAVPDLNSRLAAAVIDEFYSCCDTSDSDEVFDEYRKRSCVIGKDVVLLPFEREKEYAHALDIDRSYALIVRMESGETRRINSGEISLRLR